MDIYRYIYHIEICNYMLLGEKRWIEIDIDNRSDGWDGLNEFGGSNRYIRDLDRLDK